MENVIHALHSLGHELAVSNGALDEGHLQTVQILLVAGAQVVQHTNFLSHTLIVLSNVGTDEAGTAGNENFHDNRKNVVC